MVLWLFKLITKHIYLVFFCSIHPLKTLYYPELFNMIPDFLAYKIISGRRQKLILSFFVFVFCSFIGIGQENRGRNGWERSVIVVRNKHESLVFQFNFIFSSWPFQYNWSMISVFYQKLSKPTKMLEEKNREKLSYWYNGLWKLLNHLNGWWMALSLVCS